MSSPEPRQSNTVGTLDFVSILQPDPVYQELLHEIELLRVENQRLWDIIQERFPGAAEGEPQPAGEDGLDQDLDSSPLRRPPSANGSSHQPASDVESEQVEATPWIGLSAQPDLIETEAAQQRQDQLERTLRDFGEELIRLREELGAYIESQDAPSEWYHYAAPMDIDPSATPDRRWRATLTPRRIIRGLVWLSVILTILLIALLSYEVASSADLIF